MCTYQLIKDAATEPETAISPSRIPTENATDTQISVDKQRSARLLTSMRVAQMHHRWPNSVGHLRFYERWMEDAAT